MGFLERLKRHPTGFWFVFWGEFAERASFYGMRTLLALYMLDVFHFDKGRTGQIVQFFVAACYFMPLVGGWIADRWLGKYKTIVYFSIPYIMGHIILGGTRSTFWLFAALGLLAMGSGTIKPNISPLMGRIYEKEGKKDLLTEAFSYFYAAINMGSAITSLLLPTVRDRYGYGVALIFPTLFMVLALGVFAFGKRYYPPEESEAKKEKTPAQRALERETLLRVIEVFGLIIAFWLVYDQYSSTWVFLARDRMDLRLWPFNVHIAADQVQGLNPVFIIVLTPFFNWLWETLKRRTGREVPATRKMLLGFALTFICMAIIAAAGFLSNVARVSVWILVLATFVMTLSELCISAVGLEFAFRMAPESMQSSVTAGFLLTVFGGNFVGGFVVSRYESMSPGAYFSLQAAIVAAAGFLFFLIARRIERRQLA